MAGESARTAAHPGQEFGARPVGRIDQLHSFLRPRLGEGDHRQGIAGGRQCLFDHRQRRPSGLGLKTADQCPRPIPELGVRALTHPHPTPVRTQGQTDRVGKGEVGAGCEEFGGEGGRRRPVVIGWLHGSTMAPPGARVILPAADLWTTHPRALPVWTNLFGPSSPAAGPGRGLGTVCSCATHGGMSHAPDGSACNLRRTLAHVTCAIMWRNCRGSGTP